MARKPRIHFTGAVYHVVLTGLDGQNIYKSVADRRHWETLVEDGVKRFSHSVLAFCWARNHVQMAIRVKDAPLSKVMQNLTFRYTRYFNSKHDRNGPLFHGRYKAIAVDADTYLNDLVCYIHNNPLRGGEAKSAAAGKWTSHAGYLDSTKAPEWLMTSTVLQSFGASDKAARRAFAKFVERKADEGERVDLMKGSEGGRLLGDEKFMKKALKPVKPATKPVTLNQLVKRICKEEGVKEAEIINASRARAQSRVRQTITYIAMELNVGSLTDLAKRFNRDLTTMSRNQRYYRDKLNDDADLQKHVRKLRRQVLTG